MRMRGAEGPGARRALADEPHPPGRTTVSVTNLKALVGKLNATCRRTLEGAVGRCLSRGNYNVEVEHWLLELLGSADTDLARALRHFELDTARLTRELTRALDGLRTGNARAPQFSGEVFDLMREAWTLASLEFGAARIRTSHLLAALLADRSLSARVRSSAPELARLPAEQLRKDL